MRGKWDLVDLINNRCSKRYLHEALSLAYQEMTGCDDVEPQEIRDERLAAEADLLIYDPGDTGISVREYFM